MATRNLLVDWLNNKKNAVSDVIGNIQNVVNKSSATNVSKIKTPNSPTLPQIDTSKILRKAVPAQTATPVQTNATTNVITGPYAQMKQQEANINPLSLAMAQFRQQQGLDTANSQSRFIGFQNNQVAPKTDLAGNIIQENIPQKETLNISSRKAYQDAVYELQRDMLKNGGPLSEDDIKTYYKEFSKNVDAAMELQETIRPIVQQGYYADINDVENIFDDLLPAKKREKQNAKIVNLEERGEKLSQNYNLLSDKGQEYVDTWAEVKGFVDYVRENYELPGDPTDIDIINFGAKQVPEIEDAIKSLRKIKLSNMDKAVINRNSDTWYQNDIAAIQEGISNANSWYQNNVQNRFNDKIETGERAKRLNNGINVGGMQIGLNADAANKVSKIAQIPSNRVSGLLQGADKTVTGGSRVILGQDRSIKEVADDIIKSGGGFLGILFNATPHGAIASSVIEGADILTEEGKQPGLVTQFFQRAGGSLDELQSGKDSDGNTNYDNRFTQWYNGLDQETRADFLNEEMVAIMELLRIGGKEVKLRTDVAIDATKDAWRRTKAEIEGSEILQDAKNQRVYDPVTGTWKSGKSNLRQEFINRFKANLKENFSHYGDELSIRKGNNPLKGENELTDNRTTWEKAKSGTKDLYDEAKGEVTEGTEWVKNRVQDIKNKVTSKKNKATTPEVTEKSGGQGTQTDTEMNTTSPKEEINTSTDNQKGVEVKKGGIISEKVYDKLTGLDETTRERMKANPYSAEENKNLIDTMEDDSAFDFNEYQISRYQDVLDTIIDKLEQKENSRKNEIGPLYDKLEEANAPIDTTKLKNQTKNFSTKLDENDGIISSAEQTKINKLIAAIDSLGDGTTDVWKIRRMADQWGHWDSESTTDGIRLIREIRDAVDDIIKAQRPEMKDIDTEYRRIKDEIADLRGNLINRKSGKLRDNAVSTVKNLLNPSNRQFLERLEKEIPGITKQLQAIRDIKFVYNAYQTGNGSRFVSGIARGTLGNMFKIIGVSAGGLPGLLFGALIDKAVDTALVNLTRKALKATITEMTPKAQAELESIMKKVQEGKELTAKEKAKLKEIENKIVENADKAKKTKAEQEAWDNFLNKVKEDTNSLKLPNKGGKDGGKNILTNGKTIITDAQGNSKVKGQISEIDKRPSKPEDTTPPSAPTTPSKPTEPKNKITNKTPKKKSEPKKKTNVEKFREETAKYYPDYQSIENGAKDMAQNILKDAGVDAEIVDLVFTGSRARGLEHGDSDFDILIELKGDDLREDTLFDILNDKDVNDEYDFNPILADKTGTLEEVVKSQEKYMKQKREVKETLDSVGVKRDKETADDVGLLKSPDMIINFINRTEGPIRFEKHGETETAGAKEKNGNLPYYIGVDGGMPAPMKRILKKIADIRGEEKVEQPKNKVTSEKSKVTSPKQENNQTKHFDYKDYGEFMKKYEAAEKEINDRLDKQMDKERAEKMERFNELTKKEDKTEAEGKELVKLQGELNNMSNKYDKLKEDELKKQAPELLKQKEELQQAFDRDWKAMIDKKMKEIRGGEKKEMTAKEKDEAREKALAKPDGTLIYTNGEFKYIPSLQQGLIRMTREEGETKLREQIESAFSDPRYSINVWVDDEGNGYVYNEGRWDLDELENKTADEVIIDKDNYKGYDIMRAGSTIEFELDPETSDYHYIQIDLQDFLNNSDLSKRVESKLQNKGTSTAKNKITNTKSIEMDYFEDIDPQTLKILKDKGDKMAVDLYNEMTAEDKALMDLYDEITAEDTDRRFKSNLSENETPQDIDYQDLAEMENETPQIVDVDEGVDITTQLIDEFNNLKPGEFKWIGNNREAGVRKTFSDASIKVPGKEDSVDIFFMPGESGDKMNINLHDTSNLGIRNANEILSKLDIQYRIGSELDERNETKYFLENKLTHSKAYFDKNGASRLSVNKTLRGKEIVPRRNAEEQAEYNMQMEQRRAEIEAEREQDRIKAEERKAEEERQQEIDKQMKANLLRYVDIKHNDNPLGRGRTLKDLSEKNSEANNRIRYYGDDVADDAGVWQVLDVLADKNGKIREVWESDSKSSYSYEYYDEELGRNNNISGLNKTQRDYLEYRIKASQTEKRVNNHLDKIENKSLKTRVENKLNEMKKWQDDNGKTQYGTDAQYIDYLVLDKGFTPKEFPTGKTYANGEPKIDYMIVNEKNVGYISSKIENDYARSLLETPEEELSAEDEAKLDELFTPKTTTEVTGEKNAITAKQTESEKPKNLVTSRIENTKQEIQEIDKDTYFDDIVKNLKDHPREMFIYKDGNYFYPHYILPSGKVITPENTYWGEVSSEEAARNWLLKEAEEHSEENETKKAEKLKEIVGKTAEKYEATLKRIESDNPMQEIWTSGNYFKYGMGNNQMARAKKESEANAEVGTFKKDVIDGKEGYTIFVAGTKNEAIRAFYEPKTGKTYRIYRGPIIDDSKPYTTKQVERIEKFLGNVEKQLDKETKREKPQEKTYITQEWLDGLKPDKDGVIELDSKLNESFALRKGKEALIKEGKADGKYIENYGGERSPQYLAFYIKDGVVYEGRKGLEDQYMKTKQEAVDWLNQKEKDVEHEATERYTQTDYETLPKTISVESEAEKAGPKRIAPDRVKRQQETYDQGLESVKNVLKQSPVKIYELGFKSDRSKAVQNILEERKRIRQLPETEAEKQWNELAKSVYEDLVIKDISKGYRYPEDVTSKFPENIMKKAVDARARYEKGLFTSFSAKDTRANNQYRDEIGAGIKSQDGKPVTQEQMNEIVDGIRAYSEIFGIDMKKFAEDNNIIYVHLHGGNPFLMGGMNIGGLYRRDAAGNISVSLGGKEGVMEKGEDGEMKKTDIKTTTTHEITHAVDGMLDGKLFSNADIEILKKTMNKPKKLINYYNRPHEIVARAVEQYAAHKIGKTYYRRIIKNIDMDKGSVELGEKEYNYVDRQAYWDKENFDKYVKPIVEKNMKEKMKDYLIQQPKNNVLGNDRNRVTTQAARTSRPSIRMNVEEREKKNATANPMNKVTNKILKETKSELKELKHTISDDNIRSLQQKRKAGIGDNAEVYRGKINKRTKEVLDEMGIKGYFELVVEQNDINHLLNRHENNGRYSVTRDDVQNIPEIMLNADSIRAGGKTKTQGMNTIIFEKTIGDVKYVIAAHVGRKNKKVGPHTMRKKKA